MTASRDPKQMSDEELSAELAETERRFDELGAEKVRRLISLDGDIGRREPRIR